MLRTCTPVLRLTIVAVDLPNFRLQFARQLGADYVLNAGTTTLQQRQQSVREFTQGRGADVVVECAGVPQAVRESLELLRTGSLLVEAGNFFDMGEIAIRPHRHLCAKNVRILGVGGEEPAAYAPSMRQMARYMAHYPLREFVTHRFALRDADAALKKSMAADSMKVVTDPWL